MLSNLDNILAMTRRERPSCHQVHTCCEINTGEDVSSDLASRTAASHVIAPAGSTDERLGLQMCIPGL